MSHGNMRERLTSIETDGKSIFDEKFKLNISMQALNEMTSDQKFKLYKYLKSEVSRDANKSSSEYLNKLVLLAYFQEHGIESNEPEFRLKPLEKARGYVYDDIEADEFESTKQEIYNYAHLNVELLGRLANLPNGLVGNEIKEKFAEHNNLLVSTKNDLINTFGELKKGYDKRVDDAQNDKINFYPYNVINGQTDVEQQQNIANRYKRDFITTYSNKSVLANAVIKELNKDISSEGNVFNEVINNHTKVRSVADFFASGRNKETLTKQLSGEEQGMLKYVAKCMLVIGIALTFPISLPAAALFSKYKRGTFDFTAADGVKGIKEVEKIDEIAPAGPKQ